MIGTSFYSESCDNNKKLFRFANLWFQLSRISTTSSCWLVDKQIVLYNWNSANWFCIALSILYLWYIWCVLSYLNEYTQSSCYIVTIICTFNVHASCYWPFFLLFNSIQFDWNEAIFIITSREFMAIISGMKFQFSSAQIILIEINGVIQIYQFLHNLLMARVWISNSRCICKDSQINCEKLVETLSTQVRFTYEHKHSQWNQSWDWPKYLSKGRANGKFLSGFFF